MKNLFCIFVMAAQAHHNSLNHSFLLCVCACVRVSVSTFCVFICVWVVKNVQGVLLGAQMVLRPATAALMMATFSHGTPSFPDPTPPVQA